MEKLCIPAEVHALLTQLNAAGYAAYAVGGCVRDGLRGQAPQDWDICTSAKPQETAACFASDRVLLTGERFGTITVLRGGESYEITTFRAETGYSDSRHPDSVAFLPELRGDLMRRDFTVNAMAADADGRVTDLFGGQDDLKNGVIRCVGDPARRFSEDALRILRAWRFSAQLGFRIEDATRQAALAGADACARLSRERVRDETEKTLFSPRPELLREMIEAGMLAACGLTHCPPLDGLAALPADASRWAALKLRAPELDPAALRLPAKLCRLIERAAAAYKSQPNALALKKIIAQEGWAVAEVCAELAGAQALLEGIRASGDCVTLRQLAVTGADLPQLSGAAVGTVLHALLQHVLAHPEDNTRPRLLTLAEKIAKK